MFDAIRHQKFQVFHIISSNIIFIQLIFFDLLIAYDFYRFASFSSLFSLLKYFHNVLVILVDSDILFQIFS